MSDMTCKPSLLLRCVGALPDSISGDSSEPIHGLDVLGIGQVAGDLLRTPRDLRLGGNPHDAHGARSHIWT